MAARWLGFWFGVVALARLLWACLPELPPPPVVNACGSGIVDLSIGEACDPGDAGAVGCTATCAIDCEGGVIDPQTNHCYFWSPVATGNDEAIDMCSKLGNAHVVSFVDLQELQTVITGTKTLGGAPEGGTTWVALNKLGTNDAGVQTYLTYPGIDLPGWSASCIGCFAQADGGDADIPLNSNGTPYDCVDWRRSSTSVSWVQSSCMLTNGVPVLCEREPAGVFSSACNDDAGNDICIAVPISFAKKTYRLVTEGASFANAKTTCASLGGALVHFVTSSEREAVMAEVSRYVAGGDLWIGLTFDAAANAWTWVDDGSIAKAAFPTPWGDLEPAVNAGAATIHIERGRYDTLLAHAANDDLRTLQFICQLPK